MTAVGMVHRLRITLRDIKPPVWRRVEVSSEETLEGLHEVIQATFGWLGFHLHEFEIGGARYGVEEDDDWGDPPIGTASVTLGEVAPLGSWFGYTYDFGDDWRHRIDVEAVELVDTAVVYPRCVGGRCETPPEDVGGPWGYAEFVEAMARLDHPQHTEMVDWFGQSDFDPTHFDIDDINEALKVIHPKR